MLDDFPCFIRLRPKRLVVQLRCKICDIVGEGNACKPPSLPRQKLKQKKASLYAFIYGVLLQNERVCNAFITTKIPKLLAKRPEFCHAIQGRLCDIWFVCC